MIVACFLSPFLPNTPQRTGVKLSDGPRAITQEQLVCRVLESVERLPAGKDFTAKGIHLSAARRMGNHNGIGWTGISHTADWVMLTAVGAGHDA